MSFLLDVVEVLSGIPVEMAFINTDLSFRREVEAAHTWVWMRWPKRKIQKGDLVTENCRRPPLAAEERGANSKRRCQRKRSWRRQ